MLSVRNKDNPPRNGQGYYVYVDPDSKLRIALPSFKNLMREAKNHRRINNFPIGSNWNNEFEENVCVNTPGDMCYEKTEMSPLTMLGQFAAALMRQAASGFKVVSPEVAMQRRQICEACEHFSGAYSLMKTSCGKCRCTRLKLSWPSEKCPLNKWSAV